MPKRPADLDEKIKKGASAFADAVRHAAASAKTEADIRSAADRQLSRVEDLAGITLHPRHEYTVASGRIDSVYERVVIEYKNPNSGADRIGKTLASTGSAKLLQQIKSRFSDLENDLGHPINSLFGVGLDGNRFIFVRYRAGAWAEEEPVEVTSESASRFLYGHYLTLANLESPLWRTTSLKILERVRRRPGSSFKPFTMLYGHIKVRRPTPFMPSGSRFLGWSPVTTPSGQKRN